MRNSAKKYIYILYVVYRRCTVCSMTSSVVIEPFLKKRRKSIYLRTSPATHSNNSVIFRNKLRAPVTKKVVRGETIEQLDYS